MTEPQITLTARIKVRPGLEERCKQEMLPIIALTRAEAGCITYTLHQSEADPSQFMLYEIWASQSALDQHLAMPYLKILQTKAPEFLAEPIELINWQRIE